jgi:hypothetical protein
MPPAITCQTAGLDAFRAPSSKFGGGTDIRDAQARVFCGCANRPETYPLWDTGSGNSKREARIFALPLLDRAADYDDAVGWGVAGIHHRRKGR